MRRISVSLIGTCLFGIAMTVAACSSDTDTSSGVAVVDVFGPYRGVEADALADALERIEDQADIDVRYIGSADFVADLRNRLVGDERPDIAIIPQPGLVAFLDDRDLLVEHGPATRAVVANSSSTLFDLVPGREDVAVPHRSTIKSLVWFRPDVFEANGWNIPRTLDQLEVLTDRIAAETDIAPWCFSISSGTATGWPATDWIEDVVLRLHGPDVYDAWRDGGLGFADPAITEAFEFVDKLLLTDDRVAGGSRSLLQTDVIETGLPLFDEPAGCAMYKQASFALDWFPSSVTVGADDDVHFFVLPGTSVGEQAPLVVGGDSIVAFDDRPEVDAVTAFLASGDAGTGAAGYLGGLAEPTDSADDDPVGLLALVDDDRTIRVDASDAMDPRFGSDVLWSGMTDWMSRTEAIDSVLAALDTARSEVATE